MQCEGDCGCSGCGTSVAAPVGVPELPGVDAANIVSPVTGRLGRLRGGATSELDPSGVGRVPDAIADPVDQLPDDREIASLFGTTSAAPLFSEGRPAAMPDAAPVYGTVKPPDRGRTVVVFPPNPDPSHGQGSLWTLSGFNRSRFADPKCCVGAPAEARVSGFAKCFTRTTATKEALPTGLKGTRGQKPAPLGPFPGTGGKFAFEATCEVSKQKCLGCTVGQKFILTHANDLMRSILFDAMNALKKQPSRQHLNPDFPKDPVGVDDVDDHVWDDGVTVTCCGTKPNNRLANFDAPGGWKFEDEQGEGRFFFEVCFYSQTCQPFTIEGGYQRSCVWRRCCVLIRVDVPAKAGATDAAGAVVYSFCDPCAPNAPREEFITFPSEGEAESDARSAQSKFDQDDVEQGARE